MFNRKTLREFYISKEVFEWVKNKYGLWIKMVSLFRGQFFLYA